MKEDGLKMISRVSQRHKCRQQRHVHKHTNACIGAATSS